MSSSVHSSASALLLLLPANKRRFLLGGTAFLALGATVAHYVQQNNKKIEAKKNRGLACSSSNTQAGDDVDARTTNRRKKRSSGGQALKRLLPFLLKVAGPKVLVLLALAIGRTALSNRLARLQGYLFRAAFLQRVPLFMRNLIENVLLCGLAAGLESTMKSCVSYIELSWRHLLTSKLQKKYFSDMTYYQLSYVDRRVDVPEQRVCEDIPRLCGGLSELTRELITAAVDAAFYGYQLKCYSGTNKYTYAILAYVFGVGTFMTAAAPNFGGLFKKQQQLEGTYHQLHSRLKVNAESVALYGGMQKEGETIQESFRELLKHNAKLLNKQWTFSMVQDFLLKYLGATVAVALIIGPFFGGNMRPENNLMGRAQMLSNMRYHTSVIISLFGALGTMGGASRKLMKLGAYAERLEEMDKIMSELKNSDRDGKISHGDGEIVMVKDAILFEEAMVVTPGDNVLVKDLNLKIPQGTNLLVTGPNGSGKSSLFRVLGGLWPLAKGKIGKPGRDKQGGLSHDIFYVPQRPYVTVGTLQEQLTYPLSGGESKIEEHQLRILLKSVDLEYLIDRTGSAQEVVDWEEVLSLGEQQRLGMARLFFHKPNFAILDECTSGVTVSMEQRFCEMVKDMGCTCITISHRPALMAFHDLVLNLDGEGGWSIHQGARSQPSSTDKDSANKMRGLDSDAVLKGMTSVQMAVGEENYGEIVSRSPGSVTAQIKEWNPKQLLMPAAKSPLVRWKAILLILFGSNIQQSVGRVSAVGAVVLLRTLLQDRIANLNGKSVDLVLRQDLRGFIRLIGVSVLQSAASAVLAPSLRHIADMLALDWRAKLTKAISAKYLTGNACYITTELAGMSDADQRIAKDVDRLASELAALIPTMIKPVIDVAWFSGRLISLTGAKGAAVLYLYILVGYGTLKAVTPDFAKHLKEEYKLEGDFRNAHSRLRTHAESIAFFGGGQREGESITAYFERLLRQLHHLVSLRFNYGLADDFFAKQLPHSVTWLLTLLYSLQQKGADFTDAAVQGALVHQIRYLASVVTSVFTAFGDLLALRKRFAEIGGGVARVNELLEVVAIANGTIEDNLGSSTDIRLRDVDIASPGADSKLLVNHLSFDVKKEHSGVLIVGPQASGKTSIFRVLGGLWPQAGGAVMRPQEVFFVSQKPFMTTGTLLEQVIYPWTITQAVESIGSMPKLVTIVEKLFFSVKVGYLLEREGLNKIMNWWQVLSLGEQQRLSMARMYFHKPRFAVLDECTNAVSVEMEEELYGMARGLGITLLTASQRTASHFFKFHDRELQLGGNGSWLVRSVGKPLKSARKKS